MRKAKKHDKSVIIDSVIQELIAKGKTGIKLPYREADTKQFLYFLKCLVDKKLISQNCYDEMVIERESRTLDDELYKRFYECLKLIEK